MNPTPRKRASAVITQNQKILLVRRENDKGLYYIFPGGGVEAGETIEQAVVRELKEEAGIEIVSGEILYRSLNEMDDNTLVTCTQIDTKEPVWQEEESSEDMHVFEWVALKDLMKIPLLPEDGKMAVVKNSTKQL